MSTIESDEATRRRERLRQATAKQAELKTKYEELIASSDDGGADKVAAQIVRADAEARNARIALETGLKQAAERAEEQSRAEQARRTLELVQAHEAARAAALEFERVMAPVADAWVRVVDAYDLMIEKAGSAGSGHATLSSRGVPRLSVVWSRGMVNLAHRLMAENALQAWPLVPPLSRGLVQMAETWPADPDLSPRAAPAAQQAPQETAA